MKRLIRLLISALLFVMTTCAFAGTTAQSSNNEMSPIPRDGNAYFTVSDPDSEDGKTVREFFQFTCPYCRDMHPTIWNWGSSLPQNLIFEPTPIVTKEVGSVMAASAFYSVYLLAPNKLSSFSEEMYKKIQDKNMQLSNPAVYFAIVKDLGISPAEFQKAFKSDKVRNLVARAGRLATRFQVINTPTISVGGKYTINPEIVEGDTRRFVQLANLVVSKHLQGI